MACLMGFFKMSFTLLLHVCRAAGMLHWTVTQLQPGTLEKPTILCRRKYYANVQDKSFIIVIVFHHTSEIFQWCFQGGTFALFSSVREVIFLFVFMVGILRKLEPSLARLSIEIWDSYIVFISSSSTQCFCIKLHAFLCIWGFQSS